MAALRVKRTPYRRTIYRMLCVDCEAWEDRMTLADIRRLALAHAEDDGHAVVVTKLIEHFGKPEDES